MPGTPLARQEGETIFQRLCLNTRFALKGLALLVLGVSALFVLGFFFIAILLLVTFGAALVLTPFVLLIRPRIIRIASVTLLFLVAAGLVTPTVWEIWPRPVFEGKSEEEVEPLYKQIRNGMTHEGVTALVGKPRFIYKKADFSHQSKGSIECWRYEHGGVMGVFVDVFFGPDGKVVDKNLSD